jgi:hypothetical protein
MFVSHFEYCEDWRAEYKIPARFIGILLGSDGE